LGSLALQAARRLRLIVWWHKEVRSSQLDVRVRLGQQRSAARRNERALAVDQALPRTDCAFPYDPNIV